MAWKQSIERDQLRTFPKFLALAAGWKRDILEFWYQSDRIVGIIGSRFLPHSPVHSVRWYQDHHRVLIHHGPVVLFPVRMVLISAGSKDFPQQSKPLIRWWMRIGYQSMV